MDSEKRTRNASRRVIISEALTVLAVIITVTILALLVSGYWLNSEFKVERQGMLQISSLPTGANVEVDGASSWLQRTNTSKVVSAGEHTVVLTKDGYDSWTKTVNVSEGLLYRLHYARLFLTDRKEETILDAAKYTAASISPNRNLCLLMNGTTEWGLLNLDGDSPTVKLVDISKVFTAVSLTADATSGLFTGTIESVVWAKDNEHLLFRVVSEAGREWVILNIKNPAEKVNLTREFAADFADVKILNDSASSLLVVLNGNLHRLDVSNRQLSAILVEKVHSFDYLDSTVIFSADLTDRIAKTLAESEPEAGVEVENETDTETEPAPEIQNRYYVGLLRLGENKITPLTTTTTPAKPVVSKFYDEEYITILEDKTVELYKKQDFGKIFTGALTFTPNTIKVGHNGEFITMYSGHNIATLDMESSSLREWEIPTSEFGWFDNDMIYTVADGNLTVFDFDGYNSRNLATNVSSHFPVTITSDKWLYYFSDGALIREVIRN